MYHYHFLYDNLEDILHQTWHKVLPELFSSPSIVYAKGNQTVGRDQERL